jgi:hypothetical protein
VWLSKAQDKLEDSGQQLDHAELAEVVEDWAVASKSTGEVLEGLSEGKMGWVVMCPHEHGAQIGRGQVATGKSIKRLLQTSRQQWYSP